MLCIYAYAAAQAPQDYKQSVINSSGGTSSQGYYQFEWNVGEMALINQMSDANEKIIVTNGFLQPYLLYPSRNNTNEAFDADEVKIFPNPATQYIEINFFTKQKRQTNYPFF